MKTKVLKWCEDNNAIIEFGKKPDHTWLDIEYPLQKHDDEDLHGRCHGADTYKRLWHFAWNYICDKGKAVLYDCEDKCVCNE